MFGTTEQAALFAIQALKVEADPLLDELERIVAKQPRKVAACLAIQLIEQAVLEASSRLEDVMANHDPHDVDPTFGVPYGELVKRELDILKKLGEKGKEINDLKAAMAA